MFPIGAGQWGSFIIPGSCPSVRGTGSSVFFPARESVMAGLSRVTGMQFRQQYFADPTEVRLEFESVQVVVLRSARIPLLHQHVAKPRTGIGMAPARPRSAVRFRSEGRERFL